ncbi:MAG: permease [Firmicutes bacterium]|nr:permease [Bacillota bacterium]
MSLLYRALVETYESLVHYLPFLAIGTLITAAARVYLDQRSLARTLTRYAKTSIFLVTLFATLTPFCSCGTIAVVLSMIASTVPWGPIVAFMVSSPRSPGG